MARETYTEFESVPAEFSECGPILSSETFRDLFSLPIPKSCPICNRLFGKTQKPILSVNNVTRRKKGEKFEVIAIYHCLNCNALFSVKYNIKYLEDKPNYPSVKIPKISCSKTEVFPPSKPTRFSDYINELSHDFVETYNQAEKATQENLNSIDGLAYRKALEFLVNDYIHSTTADLTDNFENLPLAQKIEKYLCNEDIKTLAKKALWLGNDYAHISNKHPEFTVQDMCKFILAIVSWLDFQQQVKIAESVQKKDNKRHTKESEL